MAFNTSPEYWIGRLIKSATNGKLVSNRLRRVLTILILSIWIIGLIICIQGFIDARKANNYFKEQKVRLDHLNTVYSNDDGKYDNSRSDYLSGMRWAEKKMNGYFYGIYYILLCFIIPWIITRLVYWIVDADKVTEDEVKQI